jgi:DNA-binding transcriptional LysR family regulator
LALPGSLAWGELADVELFAAGRDHEHRIWPQLERLDPARLPKRVHIVEHISTALGLAAAGLGVTFSPDYVAPLARSFGLFQRTLVDPEVGRHLSLYAPRGRETAAAAAVRRHIVATAAQVVAELRAG